MQHEETSQDPGKTPQSSLAVPDKFWDSENSCVRVDELLRSYLALEKKMGAKVAARDELAETLAAAEDKAAAAAAVLAAGELDREERFSADESDISLSEPTIDAEGGSAGDADVFEIYRTAELKKLQSYFGSAGNYEAVRLRIKDWAEKNLSPELVDDLSLSYAGVIAMYRLMQTGEPSIIKGAERSEGALSKEHLRSLMASPKYWRDHDPEYLKKVEEGFKRLYPAG